MKSRYAFKETTRQPDRHLVGGIVGDLIGHCCIIEFACERLTGNRAAVKPNTLVPVVNEFGCYFEFDGVALFK